MPRTVANPEAGNGTPLFPTDAEYYAARLTYALTMARQAQVAGDARLMRSWLDYAGSCESSLERAWVGDDPTEWLKTT